MVWVISLGIIVTVIVGFSVTVSAVVGWKLTHPKHKLVDDSPENYGIAYRDIHFLSRAKDVRLEGWLLTPDKGRPLKPLTVIMSHGYAGTRLEKGLPALSLAQSLTKAGYRVVMYDFRNSGRSEGSMTTIGYLEKQDLLGAVDWVLEHEPGGIAFIGFSMGGTTSILAAADEPAILGAVADSPFSRLKPYLQANLSVWSKLPNFPFTPLILAILPRITGIKAHQVDAIAALERLYPRPVLFIHSEHDTAIPYTHSESMSSLYQDRFDFWKTKEAGHVGSFQKNPSEYTSRVVDFFEKLLN
jgi:fermentation-respiration switch protein FrsA (DUF1100 family)